MWCVPHPCKPGHTLVLLDTEGLGDTEKGDTENDTWIFVLAVLLSSTLIYNSKGTIDQQAMDNLHYVLKLSECVQVKTAPEEAGAEQAGTEQAGDEQPGSDRRTLFFPTFVWAVRDFTLQLEVDGKEISEDEYLENALKLKDGSSQEVQSYNQLRECIRQLFPERKCFVFDQPARKKDLPRLEELPDDMLDPEFQQQVERFCSYIGQNCPPKTIPGGHEITGSRLGTLAVSYVEAIRRGAVPCLESAVLALAEIENSAALKEAVALYQSQMEQGLPTETTQELLELHARCEEEAKRLFTARAFEESRERFQAELTVQLEALKEHFWMRNERVSHEKCTATLQELFQDLDRRINDGVYFMLGGYQRFQRDQQALVEQYRKLPGKGVKADAALQDFLQKRESMARTILKVDHELTEKEEQIENLKAQYERAEQEREAERKRLDEREVENLKTLLKLLNDMKARRRKKREEKENKNDHQSKDQDKKSTSGSEKKSNPEDQQNSKPGGKSGDCPRYKMWFELLERTYEILVKQSPLSSLIYEIVMAFFRSRTGTKRDV
ncbi:guanylate-binding protein 1-like [Aythya fuligula]|uniref:Guanylate-binding protein 1-like n=1 Tax=Aythya fuligula TaxID=219594 RepID=A0A6J3EG34_AYTFU|nr:guanylate-binding protein 1-like [Aythya fuligula]